MKMAVIVIGYILIIINYILTRKIYNNYTSMMNIGKKAIYNRDEIIKELKKDQEILLQNEQENRAKINDLENNIEFLFNNLSKQKRELVRPLNQN